METNFFKQQTDIERQRAEANTYKQKILACKKLRKEIKAINEKINIKVTGESQARYISSLLSVENDQNVFAQVQDIFADDKDKYKNAATNVYEAYKRQQSTPASKEAKPAVDEMTPAIKDFIGQGEQLIALSQKMSSRYQKESSRLEVNLCRMETQGKSTTYGTFTL